MLLVLTVKHQSIHDSYWANDTVPDTADILLVLAVKHQSINDRYFVLSINFLGT
jgi:hypothetical protein